MNMNKKGGEGRWCGRDTRRARRGREGRKRIER